MTTCPHCGIELETEQKPIKTIEERNAGILKVAKALEGKNKKLVLARITSWLDKRVEPELQIKKRQIYRVLGK